MSGFSGKVRLVDRLGANVHELFGGNTEITVSDGFSSPYAVNDPENKADDMVHNREKTHGG